MKNYCVPLMALLFISMGYACNSSISTADTESVKIVNNMLDEIDTPESHRSIINETAIASTFDGWKNILERRFRFLIEHPNIALPEMFKRLDNKKPHYETMVEKSDSTKLSYLALITYFIVFEKTKSSESIPYLSEYIALVSKQETEEFGGIAGGGITSALSAAQVITSLKLVDEKYSLFDQRKEIADKLNRWYAEYKKSNTKK